MVQLIEWDHRQRNRLENIELYKSIVKQAQQIQTDQNESYRKRFTSELLGFPLYLKYTEFTQSQTGTKQINNEKT